MKLIGIVLLSLLCGSALGQSLTCQYQEMLMDGEMQYTCFLTIINPDGRDDFTSIGGVHEEGRTNADVTGILRDLTESESTNIPQILCSTFQNLRAVDYSFMTITELGENTLSACTNLEWFFVPNNRIESIHERAFANNRRLRYINLQDSRLPTLPANVFNNLDNLEELRLAYNELSSLPAGVFSGLSNLRLLLLGGNQIEEINQQWFTGLGNLEFLSIYGNNVASVDDTTFASLRNLRRLEISRNPLESISAGAFRQLTNLEILQMERLNVTEINPQWFETLGNLLNLDIFGNDFRSIAENAFDRLTSLEILDLSGCHLLDSGMPGTLFQNLQNLVEINLSFNLIQNLNNEWFQNTSSLAFIHLQNNEILSIPNGFFAPISGLAELNMESNFIKTLNRASFGSLQELVYANFDDNVINAIDQSFLQDTPNLSTLYVSGNLCTGERFYDFSENRAIFVQRLSLCTTNYRFIVETETEAGADYAFFEGNEPGIQLRVNTDASVTIALSSFDVVWNPMIEIRIGVNNNTLSQIVRNQEQVVVTVPTPNILRNGGFSGFRITWSHHVILVTREDQSYPFMAYTMEDWFAVNYYGLQSENDAAWTVQPVEAEIAPTKVLKAIEV